ncbi:MAG TPA: pyrroline-5-carboxylate reductase dimerization domain-containing protein, partial [Bacilli bacterium]|nr:pyrroline-5-carboxylate reductase dimerization domain-containing protein [Bacilli bacterium]
VAAGVGVKMLEENLPSGTPVAWVMPNTAAMLGESMSLYALGQHATDKHRDVLQMILRSIGEALECTEEQIHNLTAISGAAPAFLYRVAEVLQETAMGFGLDERAAQLLVTQMFSGSAKMMQTGTPAATLRDQVTTPGGATAAGLRVLEERGLPKMFEDAVHATNARSKEMASGQK